MHDVHSGLINLAIIKLFSLEPKQMAHFCVAQHKIILTIATSTTRIYFVWSPWTVHYLLRFYYHFSRRMPGTSRAFMSPHTIYEVKGGVKWWFALLNHIGDKQTTGLTNTVFNAYIYVGEVLFDRSLHILIKHRKERLQCEHTKQWVR